MKSSFKPYLQVVVMVLLGVSFIAMSAQQQSKPSTSAQSNGSRPDPARPTPKAKTPTPSPTPTAPAPVPAPPATAPSPTATYTPNDTQRLRLENAQLRAQLAQSVYANKAQTLPEFSQFQSSVNALQQECDRTRAENSWPQQVQCDMQTAPVKFCLQLPCPVDVAGASKPTTTPKATVPEPLPPPPGGGHEEKK